MIKINFNCIYLYLFSWLFVFLQLSNWGWLSIDMKGLAEIVSNNFFSANNSIICLTINQSFFLYAVKEWRMTINENYWL